MRWRQGRMHHISRRILFPSWSHKRLRTSNGAADMTVSFFMSPDVDGTVLFIGNSVGTRKKGTITGKRGSSLRHCWYGLVVRQKWLEKLLRIPPSVLATLISSSTTLLQLSLWSNGAPSPLSLTHSISITIRSVHSFLSQMFSPSIHLTHILSVSLSRFVSIPHHHAIRSKLHTILALY